MLRHSAPSAQALVPTSSTPAVPSSGAASSSSAAAGSGAADRGSMGLARASSAGPPGSTPSNGSSTTSTTGTGSSNYSQSGGSSSSSSSRESGGGSRIGAPRRDVLGQGARMRTGVPASRLSSSTRCQGFLSLPATLTMCFTLLSVYSGLEVLLQERIESWSAEESALAGLHSPAQWAGRLSRRVGWDSALGTDRAEALEEGEGPGQGPGQGQGPREWTPLALVHRFMAFSRVLTALLSQRVDDDLTLLMPAMKLLKQQEEEARHHQGPDSSHAVAGWALRIGHWVRPPSSLIHAALEQETSFSAAKANQIPNPRRLFQPCAFQYAALDSILTEPHGCSPGERRYYYSGLWMDWDMLHLELSRPGGGGGHLKNDPVCVVACVDRPQPLCSSLHPSRNPGGAFGFPCVYLLALRQQQNNSSDVKELAEVYEAQAPLPWPSLFTGVERRRLRRKRREHRLGGEADAQSHFSERWAGAVVDAGAGVGLTSLLLATMYPGWLIVSLEESSQAFRMLQHNCQLFPNIRALNAALWPPTQAGKVRPPPPPLRGNEHQQIQLPLLFSKKFGPVVDGSFLLRVFGIPKFNVVRLNVRRGGEDFLFPKDLVSQLHMQGSTPPPLLEGTVPVTDSPLAQTAPSLDWLAKADFVVVFQKASTGYEMGDSLSGAMGEKGALLLYMTQAALSFAPVTLSPEMLRKGSMGDEDLPLVFRRVDGTEQH